MDIQSFQPLPVFVSFLIAYLLGSLPVGLFVSKILKLEDPRNIGSGNIGATNMMRTGSKKAGFLTFFGDFLKGFLPVFFLMSFDVWYTYYTLFSVCFGVVLGHIFSLYLLFRGGKGVATFVGVLLALSLKTTLFFACCWLLMVWLTRYSSLSSIVSVGLTPIIIFYLNSVDLALIILPISVVITLKHASNIKRLIQRTEPKIASK